MTVSIFCSKRIFQVWIVAPNCTRFLDAILFKLFLWHSTSCTRSITTIITMLITRVPLPREVFSTPSAILRTSTEPLHHVRVEVVDSTVTTPTAPLATFIQALCPNTLLIPEACRIPVGSKVWSQLISTTGDDILQFLLCLVIAITSSLWATESLPHQGISQVSLCHTLGTTTILVIVRFPVEKLGSLCEVFDDEVPHFLVSLSSRLHRCIAEILTCSKHWHTTESGSQPSIEVTTKRTSLALTSLFGSFTDLICLLKTCQIKVGTSNSSISMSPAFT